VEDDPSIAKLRRWGSSARGFLVSSESDGRQALLAIQSSNFDAVVLDTMLPSLDGLEVCREADATARYQS
jgi:two-component system OmpR family response regulator